MKIIFFLVLALATVAFCANDDFIATCLQVHNDERAALGIAGLTWSDDLAASALDWAKSLARKNTLKHSNNRDHIGENIARTRSKSNSLEVLLQMWTDEQIYYVDEPYPRCSSSGNKGDVGHYTQMIWQDTTEVGCGIASGFGRDYLVCQYNPSGNRMGQYAYDSTQTQVNPDAQAVESPTNIQPEVLPTEVTTEIPTSYVPEPQVQTPQVETPQVWTPQVQTPQVQTPQVQIPQVQTPQVQTTATESDPFIARCLQLHNDERSLLNIPGLTWNADLAVSALSWANQLAQKGSLSHSPNRVHIGENVSYTASKPNSIDRLIGMWLDEKKYFIYAPYPDCSNSGNSHDVGHYTQLIWKDTTELGCGVATRNGKDYLACQYKTSGNRIGKYAY